MNYISRRKFLKSVVAGSFLGLQVFTTGCSQKENDKNGHLKTDHLKTDPQGILNLPEGFSYKIISRQGKK